jgi:hypothetical protein
MRWSGGDGGWGDGKGGVSIMMMMMMMILAHTYPPATTPLLYAPL